MSFYANFGLHPTLEEYVQNIDSSAPNNVLEWMFKKCQGPIPHSPIPMAVTRQFRREVRQHYEALPFWVQRECPRLIDASTEDGSVSLLWLAHYHVIGKLIENSDLLHVGGTWYTRNHLLGCATRSNHAESSNVAFWCEGALCWIFLRRCL